MLYPFTNGQSGDLLMGRAGISTHLQTIDSYSPLKPVLLCLGQAGSLLQQERAGHPSLSAVLGCVKQLNTHRGLYHCACGHTPRGSAGTCPQVGNGSYGSCEDFLSSWVILDGYKTAQCRQGGPNCPSQASTHFTDEVTNLGQSWDWSKDPFLPLEWGLDTQGP